MNLDMEQASRVHEAAVHTGMDRFVTDHEGVHKFVRMVTVFTRRLGENVEDDFWRPIVRALRRVRYELTSLPLPHDHVELGLGQSSEFIHQRVRHVESLFPALAPATEAIVQHIAGLGESSDDPLMDAVATVLEDEDLHNLRHGVLLAAGHHLLPVRDHLRARGIRARPLTADSLTGDLAAWHLVAVGPRRWFPSYVTAAPRAHALTFVHYKCISDPEREERSFPVAFPGTRTASVRTHPKSASGEESVPLIDAEELLPVIDWQAITRSAVTSREDHDVASASLFLLADGFAVYLDARQGSRAYIVDPDAGDDQRVRQEAVAQIRAGTFLLLRSEGGGDYIQAIADQILRDKATPLRSLQAEWKNLLREKVDRLGLWAVAESLRALGCATPSDMNVRYWSSPDSIATGDVGDFMAIMKFIGLQDRAEELWVAMQLIKAAHIRAGQHIRKLLSREVISASAVELRERGVTHFDLEELDSGRLSVFRVEAKSPDLVPVSRTQLRHPFKVGRDLWHG